QRFPERGALASYRLDVQGGLIRLLGALADDQVAFAAPHNGVMGVTSPFRGLENPFDGYFGMYAFDGVVHLAVGVNLQEAVPDDVFLQVVGKGFGSSDLAELLQA